ncbi:unnamed protein product [Heligmosomoides polygyrus]|uniref:CCHC-type domain-containing protein n=1 Tax=Heligmosomoides polygyrus TaxID=6339 RepID=A0A183F226_HELPZ|nr:unnamed protein product [Heligmosomoides polygyrus]
MPEDAIEKEVEAMMLLEGEDRTVANLQEQVAGLTEKVRQHAGTQTPQGEYTKFCIGQNAWKTGEVTNRAFGSTGGFPRGSQNKPGSLQTTFGEAMQRVHSNTVPQGDEMLDFDPIAAAEETAARERAAKAATVQEEPSQDSRKLRRMAEMQREKKEVVCHNCKKTGNLSRDCKELVPRATVVQPSLSTPDQGEKRQKPQGKQRSFVAKRKTWACGISETGVQSSELTGSQIVAEVELLGQKVKALLDTGSQVSILPLALLLKAAHAGFDLDNDVEEIPTAEEVPIFNASGQPAVKEKEGVRLAHPSIFSHHLGYDISAYYAQAIVRREQISEQCSDDMPTNSIILAVPKSFGRVLTGFEPEPTVEFVVYSHLADMADQLDKLAISAAVVRVWPESTPSSPNMRTCLQAIERHLQCGGTLDCFPAPFEELRQDLWEQMRRVCVEVVHMLTGPKRGFDARVIHHYGPCAEDILKLHPALSLGLSPRKADHCFHGWQVQVFLEQLRDAASNTLRLPRFKLKERRPKEAPNKATTSATVKENHDGDEPTPKKRKLPKRPEVMYLRREINTDYDLAPELDRKKRAAWGAFKSVEEVVKETKNVLLAVHLFC